MSETMQFELSIRGRDAIIQVRRDNYNGIVTVIDAYYDEDGYPPIGEDDMPEDDRLVEMAERELAQ